MNKNSFDGAYLAPEISIIDINAEGVLCQSGFGDENQAGAAMNSIIWNNGQDF